MNHSSFLLRRFKLGGLILTVFAIAALGFSPCFAGQAQNGNDSAGDSLFEMSLEELMKMSVTSGTLTDTTRRYTPSAITVIDQKMIQSSGARSLDELFEIYVPNFQIIRHHAISDHVGIRGIIGDRDDKFLLLVNGRIMNERTDFGVVSERDLVMLGDIHHIDVVRGPGSAIYGPGAVAMVINIITENANTFQGTELTTKIGFIEEFYSVELKHGRMLDDETGLFLYGSFSDYVGADQHDSPMVFGTDFTARFDPPGTPSVEQGEGVEYSINKDREAYRELPKFKFHGQITTDDFDFWVRYTRGGTHYTWDQDTVARDPAGRLATDRAKDTFFQTGLGYQQLTVYAKYHKDLSDTFGVDYVFSYDLFDLERPISGTLLQLANIGIWKHSFREDEYFFRILGRWKPNENHSVALGVERSWEIFGLKSIGFPDESPTAPTFGNEKMPRWSTNTDSIFGEYQWKWNDQIRTFWGMRVDKSDYVDELRSPRAALIYTPTAIDTYKFMISRSVRAPFASRSRANIQSNLDRAEPEVLDSLEVRWERQHSKNLWFATSVFYNELEVIGFGGAGIGQTVVGDMDFWGIEFEATYASERLHLQLSHGYTKLIDFAQKSDISQLITAEPFGFGDDLAMWSNHISKLYAKYKLNEKWSADGSMQFYWGFPGKKDFVEYRDTIDETRDGNDKILRNPGYNDPFGPSVFLNLGLEYKRNADAPIRFDGYNLLGFIDEELNKRIFLGEFADYRSHAPAFGISLRYTF